MVLEKHFNCNFIKKFYGLKNLKFQILKKTENFNACWFQDLIAPINVLNINSGLFQFKVFLTRSFNMS